MSQRRVLVIDDEAGLRHTLLLILRDEGYRVTVADDAVQRVPRRVPQHEQRLVARRRLEQALERVEAG